MSVFLTWVSTAMTVLLLVSSGPLQTQTLTTSPNSSALHTVLSAVPFARPEGVELVADLYLPVGPGPFPAIVFIHGGGWSSGDRTQLRRQAALMADQGMVGMAIEYRLAPAHPFPAAVEDARAAVVWLRGQAAGYRIDPTRIGVVGSSAGGHLAAMLGVENLGQAGEPPFLLMHGTADQTAPYAQATSFLAKLHAAGNTSSELLSIPDAPHTFWSKPQWAQLSDETMAAFLHRQLDR